MMRIDRRSLPAEWQWVKLGDVCDLVGDSLNPLDYADTSFAHYSIPAFDAGRKPIIELGERILSNKIEFPNGAVLFSKLNPRISRVWYVNDNHSYHRICSTEFLPLKPRRDLIDPHFLEWMLQEPEFVSMLRSKVAAATKSRERLKPDIVVTAIIPLPPLDEQRRIAAILSEQLAAVERARIAAEAQLEAAEALPAAYLREVFESEEAKAWPRHKIGDIATSVQNGIYKPAEYYGHGYPMLRMYNIRNDTWALTLERLALVELDKTELETFGLRAGDLLVSRVNSFELVGKCAFADARVNGYVFENMLIRIRLTDTVDSLFIAHQMGNSAVRRQIESVAKRAIGQSSINSTDVRNIEIALPSLNEQKRISVMLNDQMASVERTRQALQAQLDGINQLPAALLRQAFNGEI